MKSIHSSKRKSKPIDLSKVGVINCITAERSALSAQELTEWSSNNGLVDPITLVKTESEDRSSNAEDANILLEWRAIAKHPELPEYIILGKNLREPAINAVIQTLRKRSKLRQQTLYFGDNQHKTSNAPWTSRWTQKILFDFDASKASSDILVCRRSSFLTVLPHVPESLSGSNNEIKYIAERIGMFTRSVDASFTTNHKIPGVLALCLKRIQLSLQWYLVHPWKRSRQESWWTNAQKWSHENMAMWRMLFAATAIILMFGLPILSFDYGVTWDEQIENDYGKDALNYLLSGGKDKRVFDESIHLYAPMRNYGMIFNVTAAAVYKFLSPFGEFETKHILNAWTGLLALIFIGLIGKRLGGWRFGFLAMFFLLLSPRFFGHSMTNPKDIPFAAGYVMGIWAIIKIFEELPKPRKRTLFWAILALGFVMGIRIGGLMVVCYLAMMMGLHWLGILRKKGVATGMSLMPKYALYFAIMAIGGYVIAILTWPYALEGPIKHPLEALSAITNVQYIVSYELFSGERTNMADLSWSYIPKWLVISTPLVVLLGGLLSPVSFFPRRRPYKYKMLLFCLFVVVFPMSYVIYQGSVLYNGWRHFLFFAPFIALIGALGWDSLFRYKISKPILYLSLVPLIALSAKPLWWMIKNHPYQYVYFNELVGGINGAYGNYETDYYGLSMREGLEWLVKHEDIADGRKVRVGVNCEIQTANYWAKKYGDNITIVWNRHYEKHKNQWDYALFASRTMSKTELLNGSYPPEGTIHTIKVDDAPVLAIIKHNNTFLHDGYKALNDNRVTEAIQLFQNAAEYDPKNEEAQRMLGLGYYTFRNYDEANKAFDEAIKIWPESYLALLYKSQIALETANYQDCYAYALKSIESKSNVQGAHLNAARAAMQLGLFDESRTHLENAFKYSGGNRNSQSDIHALMGQSYLLQIQSSGQALSGVQQKSFLSDAVNQLARAIEINAGNRSAIQLIIPALEQLGDETNANRYRQMLING